VSPPNILYIHSHDTGRCIQPYGFPAATPDLQRLAEQGVLFRQCFCAAPTCSPSRAALVTGCYPHENGMLGLSHRGFRLNDPSQHVLHTLKGRGYETVLAGHQHVYHGADPCEGIGYDRYLGSHVDDAGLRGALEFLAERHDRPFFLAVGFTETHRAFPEPGPADDPRYVRPVPTLPDTPEIRQDMAAFLAAARQVDRKMGMVVDALDEAGLADETLVVCTTDHGPPFPAMKCHLTDHGTGVMLILRGPGGFVGGTVCDAMVSHLDIFPTLCDLAGAQRPHWLRGESLLPLVRGRRDGLHEELFAEVNWHACYEPMRGVRTARYKYIRRYSDYDRPHRPNTDGGPGRRLWMRHGWPERRLATEELYDLIFDPGEGCNLAGRPEMSDVLAQMRQRLDRWQRRTADPIADGAMPIPVGARLCRQDAEHSRTGAAEWNGQEWIDVKPAARK